ncbi:MAG: hypothetical protein IE879_02305 [Sulfuricurvum sp.]|nr:hypothetical protein [Sulfuricurvum sp.]
MSIFFNSIPPIRMRDPLADMLGAAPNGIMSYSYSDCVKLAGHSCPTVAGIYLMLQKGLKELYGDDLPERGNIRVSMSGRLGEGVVGVMANVASFITGATDNSGFHGLNGAFDRRNLLSYEADIVGDIALKRCDNGKKVTLSYNPKIIPSDPKMASWMQMILSGNSDSKLKQQFQSAWQERVRLILTDYANHPELVTLTSEDSLELP